MPFKKFIFNGATGLLPTKMNSRQFRQQIHLTTILFQDFCMVSSEANTLFLLSEMPEACNFIKKRLWHRVFPVNSPKCLRTTILKNMVFVFPGPWLWLRPSVPICIYGPRPQFVFTSLGYIE